MRLDERLLRRIACQIKLDLSGTVEQVLLQYSLSILNLTSMENVFKCKALSFTPKSVNLLTHCQAHNRGIKKSGTLVIRLTADLFAKKYRADLQPELSMMTRVGKAWKIVPRLDEPKDCKWIALDNNAQIMEDGLC